MSAQHTPGPWEVTGGLHYTHEISALSKQGKKWVIGRVSNAKVGANQAKANAHLIAAAPDLLEALEDALEHIPDTLSTRARAAIAKAKQTTPQSCHS